MTCWLIVILARFGKSAIEALLGTPWTSGGPLIDEELLLFFVSMAGPFFRTLQLGLTLVISFFLDVFERLLTDFAFFFRRGTMPQVDGGGINSLSDSRLEELTKDFDLSR